LSEFFPSYMYSISRKLGQEESHLRGKFSSSMPKFMVV
jgi:hypothetical protein